MIALPLLAHTNNTVSGVSFALDQDLGTQVQNHFASASGLEAMLHPSSFLILLGGPFGVPELKLANLTSMSASLLGIPRASI